MLKIQEVKIFPVKEQTFTLIGDQTEAIDRLQRRTERSKNLTSRYTDKSFLGIINGNHFKLISSKIGKGAFCVMTGEIIDGKGNVKVEVNKVFKILLSIVLCFPVIAIIITFLTGTEEFSPIFIIVVIGQILIIRYAFIGLTFKFLSNASLNRLRDVLDFE
ncbi:MAG: hypothetical protein ACI9Y7_000889 [Dokdonia sp.]